MVRRRVFLYINVLHIIQKGDVGINRHFKLYDDLFSACPIENLRNILTIVRNSKLITY